MVKTISYVKLRALVEWCEPRPNVVQGVKQPPEAWADLTSALRELERCRAAVKAAVDGLQEIRQMWWADHHGNTHPITEPGHAQDHARGTLLIIKEKLRG